MANASTVNNHSIEIQEKLLSFRSRLLHFACRKLPEWDAEDAVQETLIKGYCGLKALKNQERLQSWLFAICRNEIINTMQHGRREILMDNLDVYESKGTQPIQFFTDKIDHLFDKLSPGKQQLIRMKHIDGLSYRKIAMLLGISEALVKSRLYEARQKLIGLSRNPEDRSMKSSLFKERIMKSLSIIESTADVFSCLSLNDQATIVKDIQSGRPINSMTQKEIARLENGKSILDVTGGILDERDLAAILALSDEGVGKRLFNFLPDSNFLKSVKKTMALPDLIQKDDRALQMTTEEVPNNARAIILCLNGYIDNYNAGQFLEEVINLVESGIRLIVFDCSKLRYISGTGIGAFAKIQNMIAVLCGELAILSLSDPIREVFRLLGIEKFFSFFCDRRKALNWIAQLPASESEVVSQTPPLQDESMQSFSKLQLDLLPLNRGEEGAVLPEIQFEIESMEICGFFRPSPAFSGDYFQYYQLGHLFLIIKCDASGHTPETANVMIKISALFSQTVNRALDLSNRQQTSIDDHTSILVNVMEQLNSSLSIPDLSGQFAALQIALIDPESSRCMAVNAGDQLAFIYRQNDGMKTQQLTSNPCVGLFSTDLVRKRGGFAIDQINLNAGDALFFLTDGIEESMRHHRDGKGQIMETNEGYPIEEPFGMNRINSIVETALSGGTYKMNLDNVMGQTMKHVIDFTQNGRTLRSAIDGLAIGEFLFRAFPDHARIRTDSSTDTLLKRYFNGYQQLLGNGKIQLETGVVYQNLNMDTQKEDLTILAVRRKT